MDPTVTIRNKQDVYNIVNNGIVKSKQSWMIIVIALGGTFIDAYDFTSLGIGAVQLKDQFHLSAVQLGSITAAMAFGALIAALIGGYYVDKVGRLKMFMLDLVFFVVAALGAAFSTNLFWLLAFRFLMGVGVGLDFPVALSFVAEYTAISSKGKAVNIWQMLWYIAATVGFVVIIPIYYAGAGSNLWRYAVGIGAIPALIVLILRYMYMNESPMWAASRGDLEGAAEILRSVYGLKVKVSRSGKAAAMPQKSALAQIGILFSKHYRSRTTLAAVIGATQSMEYFALGFYLPTISILIFGKDVAMALIGSAIFNAFGIIGGAANVKYTQRLGVRRMAIIGYSIVVITLIIIGVFKPALPVFLAALLVAVFIFAHSFGQGAAGMTMGAISYPTSIRGVGSGFTQASIRVGSILGFYFFPLVLAAVGLAHTLLILAIVPLLGLLVSLRIHWEPVGKDIDQEDGATA